MCVCVCVLLCMSKSIACQFQDECKHHQKEKNIIIIALWLDLYSIVMETLRNASLSDKKWCTLLVLKSSIFNQMNISIRWLEFQKRTSFLIIGFQQSVWIQKMYRRIDKDYTKYAHETYEIVLFRNDVRGRLKPCHRAYSKMPLIYTI